MVQQYVGKLKKDVLCRFLRKYTAEGRRVYYHLLLWSLGSALLTAGVWVCMMMRLLLRY